MTRAWPGITWCPSPWDTTMNLSVVGSGPTRIPGKSDRRRCLMSEDFPVEYWPITRTWGKTSKSTSDRDGLWKSWKLYIFSRGSNLFLKLIRVNALRDRNWNPTCRHPLDHPPLLTYCSLSATNWIWKFITVSDFYYYDENSIVLLPFCHRYLWVCVLQSCIEPKRMRRFCQTQILGRDRT